MHNTHYQWIIQHPTYWTVTVNPHNFTFIDFIQGFVPLDMFEHIWTIVKSNQIAHYIISNLFNSIFSFTYNNIWIPRCKLVIEHEKSLGVHKAYKHSSSANSEFYKFRPFINIDFSLSDFVFNTDFDFYMDSCITTNSLLFPFWAACSCLLLFW